jgi:hypothetical protein
MNGDCGSEYRMSNLAAARISTRWPCHTVEGNGNLRGIFGLQFLPRMTRRTAIDGFKRKNEMRNSTMQTSVSRQLPRMTVLCRVIVLFAALTLSACFQPSPLKWDESVVLPDGRIVVLHRVQNFDEYDHVAAHSFEFEHPTTKQAIRWQSDGFFRLVALLMVEEKPHILVTPTFGSHNEQAGCPYPPMLIFRFTGRDWQQIPYAQSPVRLVVNNTTLDPKADRDYIKGRGNRLGAGGVKVRNDPMIPEHQGLNMDKFPTQVFQCPERKRFDFQ